ncbi:hypothetical protein ACFX59_17085 [Sphingomonas sp. NCPPB 2930]|uniref:hypothetical protein n=1 Tax=Sphingomonas sp. NCPPB 2930 TaxID=3162788 RepID=UPI0036D867B2
MYDQIMLEPRRGDDQWNKDYDTLVAAWREVQVCPAPIARFSTTADHIGHFYFTAGPAGAAAFYLTKRAFDVLNIWMQGRAGRKVHVRLADGTELSATTSDELIKIASVVDKFRTPVGAVPDRAKTEIEQGSAHDA